MSHWPFWAGALALATVATLHWVFVGELMSVSGRFTSITSRFRGGRESAVPPLAFLISIALGGALSVAMAPARFAIAWNPGVLFQQTFGSSPWVAGAVILIGGVLVGAGTRMAQGCTSGHGLCGVARVQKGSLVATAAFFGAGVLTSFALGALS